MERPDAARRLIVNADDFGRSPGINAAILQAHREGILTSASLMVNEPACAEAVAIAREHPALGIGLHLALVLGRSALPASRIPGLVNGDGEFNTCAVRAGCAYFFQRALRQQLQDEIEAQMEKFRATGLPLDHVNGHLNIHLHPVVLSILLENAGRWGIRALRLTCDSHRVDRRIGSGPSAYRWSHWLIYRLLSARSRPLLARRGIRHTGRVFGLLQNARVDETYVLRLLPLLPPGESELYSHPSLDEFKHELEALVSPRVKALAAELGVRLIRYQDL